MRHPWAVSLQAGLSRMPRDQPATQALRAGDMREAVMFDRRLRYWFTLFAFGAATIAPTPIIAQEGKYQPITRSDIVRKLRKPIPSHIRRGTHSIGDIINDRDMRRALPVVAFDGAAINFAYNSAEPDARSRKQLDAIYDALIELRRSGVRSFLFLGHTDAVGSRAYNQKLSERRAIAIRRRVLSNRVVLEKLRGDGLSISAAGRGERDLRVETSGRDRRNRRVELYVLPEAVADTSLGLARNDGLQTLLIQVENPRLGILSSEINFVLGATECATTIDWDVDVRNSHRYRTRHNRGTCAIMARLRDALAGTRPNGERGLSLQRVGARHVRISR